VGQDFQAEYEGSIPFTRSNAFGHLQILRFPFRQACSTALVRTAICSTIASATVDVFKRIAENIAAD
jgi:hypothetical protein